MKQKLSLLTILFGLLIVSFSVFYMAVRMEYENIEFEDAAFESAVLELLGQESGPVYRHQVSEITTLNFSNKNISYLDGIEAFSNVTVLNLENNTIKDLSPLGALNKLEILNLRNNGIVDLNAVNIDVLESIKTLRELNLRHNILVDDSFNNDVIRLYDLNPLSELTQLERLILRDNDIQSLTPLENMTNLRYLDVSQNRVEKSSFDILEGLFQLEYLNLRETDIEDLSVLVSLRGLTVLNLHSNSNVESIEPLKALISLEVLILENVPIKEEIIHLSNLTRLHRLNLRNTQIETLQPIESLMIKGALQDKPALGIYAEVDLRDNPIPILEASSQDGYQVLKDYWENVTRREPYVLPINPSKEIYINEFSISNGDTLADYDGDFPDWIELYNPNDYAIDLTGYFLSDDVNFPLKWQFPSNTIISPKGYLIVFASNKDMRMPNGELHTNFALSSTGESIILTKNDRTTLVDQTYAVIVPRNNSYARLMDGSESWGFFDRFNITPGSSNNNANDYEIPD